MEEIWKDIKGWEGKYQVSNLGRVKSLKYRNTQCEQIMIPAQKPNGYLFVGFRTPGNSKKHYYVHRLVAEAFIPNPDNFPQINHIDENKSNNHVDNLEWCTCQYNLNYGDRHKREVQTQQQTHPSNKPVSRYTIDGKYIDSFISCREAERKAGVCSQSIGQCCLGKLKTAGGFTWRFTT